MFNGNNKYIQEVIVHEHVKTSLKKQTIFKVDEEIRCLQRERIRKICTLFHAPYYDIDATEYEILLTERFYVLGKMDQEEQKKFYQEVVYKYIPEKKLIVKPHPDDAIDYREIFLNAIVVPREAPAELLPYLFRKSAKRILAGNTTAVNSLSAFFTIERYKWKEGKI